MKKFFRFMLLAFLLFVFFLPLNPASSQGADGPTYVVQAGDTLYAIALRFRVPFEELRQANQLGDPNLIKAGDRLVIPGMEGVQGTLVTRTVLYGETLRSMSRQYRITPDQLARLNRLTSPVELYAGADLIMVENEAPALEGKRVTLKPGQSLLELAVINNLNPWTIASQNNLPNRSTSLPGDVLRLTGEAGSGPGSLPSQIEAVEIEPLPLIQGKTTVVRVRSTVPLDLSGQLNDRQLSFFEENSGSHVALQGVHAMLEPGAYPLSLSGTLDDGTPIGFTQFIYLSSGEYAYEQLSVEETTLDPAITKPEDEQWWALGEPVTSERLWKGEFSFISDPLFNDCWPSTFGRRRSYNQRGYFNYHTGLDICGGTGTPIYATADGEVVFTGLLTVRGNATVINHGWGVYSAYMHQDEILVDTGDQVEAGQLIGRVGATGRVTGPHLHWEVWVGGIPVDPLDWLERTYP